MQERRRCVNPLPVDDTVAKARMFHLAQGVLVGLADGLPKGFTANSPTLHRGSFALARRRRLRTRAHRRPSTVQRLQRREDERRGQRRAPAHHAPPKETTHLIRTHERKVTRHLFTTRSAVPGWNQRTAGSDAEGAMAGREVTPFLLGNSAFAPHVSPNDAR